MNKAELIDRVVAIANTSKAEANRVVDAVFSAITNALTGDESVTIIGFGTFKKSKRKARKGRNPQTGAEIFISERNTAVFTPGKMLKDSLNR